MRTAVLSALGLLIVVVFAGMAQAEDEFQVGEKWIYEHEGMVPMRPPDYTLNGNRIREVVSVQGDEVQKRWIILEQWGDHDEQAGTRTVDANRQYDKIEGRGDWESSVEPAYPYDCMNLKPEEEIQTESTFHFGENWTFPLKMKAKRVQDETVTVPAGTYENCIHVECEETVVFTNQQGDEISIVTKSQRWYHPSVNGMVKETLTRETPGGSDTGTSVLKSYTKEKKEE